MLWTSFLKALREFTLTLSTFVKQKLSERIALKKSVNHNIIHRREQRQKGQKDHLCSS